ncbi:hypothetical protein FRX31_029182 [Thalictrum thalictroides]|uniref:Reverse transcriptase zinc-binding domain-containing protein n=1 Tax=Thalictrum thalictroides TaxID=46969 RepID=A0A7J6VAI3_THATH|nr:hypothetical protein FRX31_029182 [Thalictrum thalictroides]
MIIPCLGGQILPVDWLSKLGMIIPNRCSLCQKEKENSEHLFQTCSFTSKVWDALMNGVTTDGRRKLKNWPKFNSSRWVTTVWQMTP